MDSMIESIEKSIMETCHMTDDLTTAPEGDKKKSAVKQALVALGKAEAALKQANELVAQCDALQALIFELDDSILGLENAVSDNTASEYDGWRIPCCCSWHP